MVSGDIMRQLVKDRFRPFRGQKGLTLVEVVVAVAILGAIGVAFMTAMTTAQKGVGVLDEKTQAKALAHSQLEQIKNAPYPVEEPFYGTDVYLVAVDLPTQYSMVINVVPPTCIGETDNCTPLEELLPEEDNVQYIQEITVSVFRTGSEGDRPVFSLSCYKSKVE